MSKERSSNHAEETITNEIGWIVEENSEINGEQIVRVTSFEEAGLLTMDNGFVITLKGGSSIHVTVQAYGIDDADEEEAEEDEE